VVWLPEIGKEASLEGMVSSVRQGNGDRVFFARFLFRPVNDRFIQAA